MTAAEEARAHIAAATPGPWRYIGKGHIECPTMPVTTEANWGQPTDGLPWYDVALQGDWGTFRDQDIALMAAAPTLLARLADEVDRLTGERDEVKMSALTWELTAHAVSRDNDRLRAALKQIPMMLHRASYRPEITRIIDAALAGES